MIVFASERINTWFIIFVHYDKVCDEEIMTNDDNDDNLESNLLTSSLFKKDVWFTCWYKMRWMFTA